MTLTLLLIVLGSGGFHTGTVEVVTLRITGRSSPRAPTTTTLVGTYSRLYPWPKWTSNQPWSVLSRGIENFSKSFGL